MKNTEAGANAREQNLEFEGTNSKTSIDTMKSRKEADYIRTKHSSFYKFCDHSCCGIACFKQTIVGHFCPPVVAYVLHRTFSFSRLSSFFPNETNHNIQELLPWDLRRGKTIIFLFTGKEKVEGFLRGARSFRTFQNTSRRPHQTHTTLPKFMVFH